MKTNILTILSKISTFITGVFPVFLFLFFFRILMQQCTLVSYISCKESNL